ncbi:MAG: 50S ribosomal protein L16 [Candidatus Brennerbacteria bacterium CG11_big_fil_rev_8_21_14_0_20_43_10]|uniref:Large ribosomal subunit protein uL16 n=3 Tax=Candidatus Brenneribacteriota TaxID=1817902 RepID=A0A2M8C352_9BACT|nr:MAG: 50S ribosomal protein L16 [Parcubacteria group bacterium CG1_02_44_31]PIP50441.1 MAG: 50S ribosomal protein L16 [Candidatus Brennerbacteria bacterium CG23_combo_of_CG06-09_8_20_14_all_44_41]PIR26161.1 MAG: 50S ribosomal protein L16 [Candidatus Brennerbacteria bacterium CG11_big_fil_rev_8_21_14_0_20_43_10]PIX28754.1 MAG: 50S ribosomal protein L16 [Candidatus Brennerbacteria bacterium CG_4_8_14_3_um_filter_43_14]PJA19862.1 MAG: 50S ribosomal protein L16 [Candidatus Brennerbacteria bacteri
MLTPKKVKHRKWHKGRSRGRDIETRGIYLAFGAYGLQALGTIWMTSAQIEAARRVLAKFVKKGGKMWIRIFPDKPVTKKPPEVTMGMGKGAVDHYVFPVKPGRVLFEIDGIPADQAKKALKLAGYKLPIKTRVITRE